MSGNLDFMVYALWGRGAALQSELGLFITVVNLVIHLPFTDLPFFFCHSVGGGSAGCVIANRLSANPNVTVLLLEAGGLETASRQIPAAAPFNLRRHDDWDYHSVPQSNAALFFHEQAGTFIDLRHLRSLYTPVQRLPLSCGKVLGGSSVLNFMLYTRGNPGDYERWVRDYGATGWGYQDVLPHFKEIEDYRAGPVDREYFRKTDNQSVAANRSSSHSTISIPTSTEFMQFLHTADNATDSDIPDIEIVPISTSPASELFKAMMVELGLMPEAESLSSTQRTQPTNHWNIIPLLVQAFDGIIGPTDGRLSFRGVVVLNRPKSGGSITLCSADPNDDPDIDPRILEHPDDVRRAAEGELYGLPLHRCFLKPSKRNDMDNDDSKQNEDEMHPSVLIAGTRKFIDQVLGTEATQSIGAKPWNVTFTPCAEAVALWSQGYIECLFRHAAHTMWHMCCTVPMGSHAKAVLDERLRIRGNVTNLRVADASVMPDIVSGHTHAPAMMIGSKAAAMIIEDHGGHQ
ncbi:putative GMC-type oxidoreductase Mb1310 [Rhipicephalus microplus]|uniref:putative GMC-type oxidoreductase Mb1310 n=1 Tax=Rhipicephalus microplus TaxID=6941 RepID=UPI003F6C6481